MALVAACSDSSKGGSGNGSANEGGTTGGGPRPFEGTVETPADPKPTEPLVDEGNRVEGPTGKLFGKSVQSFAVLTAAGELRSVGVDVPLEAFVAAPADGPFQEELLLKMPQVGNTRAIVDHLRVNWLADGHGPVAYLEPHFDLHFHTRPVEEIDAINCRDRRQPAKDLVPAGYEAPTLCVSEMGFHSWPSEDLKPDAKLTKTMVLGYYAQKLAFLEPMIAKTTLLEKKSFEMPIAKAASAGGDHALYPTRLLVTFDEAASRYTFTFDHFEPID